jgi:N-acyl-D-amino-acid deacylase
VIRGGTVVDGTGAPGRVADVAVDGDRIIGIGDVGDTGDAAVLDATGLAVVPGFVNVHSHAWASLQLDGAGASDLVQGVTTEVFGESFSLGPCDERFAPLVEQWGDLEGARVQFDHLADGLGAVAGGGIAPNIASFIGGANLRILGAGFDDRPLSPAELDRVRGVVAEEMQDGALGIGTALIYPPGRFADTEELVALAEVVGRYGGVYISHMRSEADRFIECLDELLEIGRRASVATEVYHLKAAGPANHHKMKLAIERIEAARSAGQPVSADMYPYEAGGTSLAAAHPPP